MYLITYKETHVVYRTTWIFFFFFLEIHKFTVRNSKHSHEEREASRFSTPTGRVSYQGLCKYLAARAASATAAYLTWFSKRLAGFGCHGWAAGLILVGIRSVGSQTEARGSCTCKAVARFGRIAVVYLIRYLPVKKRKQKNTIMWFLGIVKKRSQS